MDRVRIGILFGGQQETHALSVAAAAAITRNLDLTRYEPVFIGITAEGVWKLCAGPDADWERGYCRLVGLPLDKRDRGLLVLDEKGQGERIHVDVMIPVLHGRQEVAEWIG